MVNRHLMVKSLILWLCLACLSTLQATPKIVTWETSNGARVLFAQAPEIPILDVRVVFDAGGARDADLPGIAKLTNALLSEGAGDLDADAIALQIESVGAQLSTESFRDMAVISLRTLTEEAAMQTALGTMATVMAKPNFAETAINRNLQALKIVLRQEQQSPADIADKAFYKSLYQQHPYAQPVNGTEASIAALDRQAVVDFYKRYYVAANAVVAMVGDIDEAQARKISEQLTADLPRGQAADALPKVAKTAAKRQLISYPSQQAHLSMGLPVLSRGDADYFALYVGNHILGGSGLVSLISNEIREKRGLAYSSYSYFSPMSQAGPFKIGLQTKNSQVAEAEQVVLQTVKDFIKNGPSEDQLIRAKQNITGGFPLRIASNKNIISYLAMLGFYKLPLNYLDTFIDNVNAVTAESIRDAFQRRVDVTSLSTVIVGQLDSN